MKTRIVKTGMISRTEMFRMMALAESVNHGLLFVGAVGTGKTRVVLDYIASEIQSEYANNVTDDTEEPSEADIVQARSTNESINKTINSDDIFILETDEGTRASAVKGIVDIQKLVLENVYDMITPIATAKTILINEVDKASGPMRNSLLGVMNERRIFNGKNKIPCDWEMFIATCNIIPEDEMGSPFWDRFPLKCEVSRITSTQLLKYFEEGGEQREQIITLKIPEFKDMESLVIPQEKMEKFLGVAYEHCSDRTLVMVPKIVKAITFIWRCSLDKAFIKCAELLINKSAASKLSQELLSPEMKIIHNAIQMIQVADSEDRRKQEIENVKNLVTKYLKEGKITPDQIREMEHIVASIADSQVQQTDTELSDEDFVVTLK